MATADTNPHVIIGTNGEASIEGTRYTVRHIAWEQYSYGWSAEEILRQHPDLRPAEVHAALAYFHDHHDTIVAAIEAGRTQAERARKSEPFSRDELLRRRAATNDHRALFAPQGTPIGRMIKDSELCLSSLSADEFRSRLVHLPLR